MNVSKDVFRAFYEADATGKSKIVVVGKVMETNGSTTTLIRADPYGNKSTVLALEVHTEAFPGKFHPHIAYEKEIRYQEPANEGEFTEVRIKYDGGEFTIAVEAAQK